MNATCVIPAFNEPAERLAATVASARAAGFDDVIVVDDGSEAPAEADGAKVIRIERNRGCPTALNVGFDAAADGWVARLDCGDLLRPNKADQIADALLHGAPATFSDAVYIGTENVVRPVEAWRNRIYTDAQFASSTTVVYRSVWAALPFNESLAYFDDWDWMLRVHAKFGWHYFPQITADIACLPGGITDRGKTDPERWKTRAAVMAAGKRLRQGAAL